MSEERLLSIGSFAMLTGLTVTALRHYDEVGVLAPDHKDPRTGYRYYRARQVDAARTVRALRAIDLPVDAVKEILEADDETYVRSVLVAHRDRLAERAHVLTEQLAALESFIEEGIAVAPTKGNRIVMINIAVNDLEASRRFYEATLDVEFATESHDDGAAHLNATFGEWNTNSWFLVALWPNPSRAGSADIGFLVEDLDATYRRALDSGGTDVHGPTDKPGMPRNAYVTDPSGNSVGLYQG